MVSIRDWVCAECGQPVTDATKARMLSADPKAPTGSVWSLEMVDQDNGDDFENAHMVGVFSDRSKIARIMLRDMIYGKETIKTALNFHWYQSAFNIDSFEGWAEEGQDIHGEYYALHLHLEGIDQPGGFIRDRK